MMTPTSRATVALLILALSRGSVFIVNTRTPYHPGSLDDAALGTFANRVRRFHFRCRHHGYPSSFTRMTRQVWISFLPLVYSRCAYGQHTRKSCRNARVTSTDEQHLPRCATAAIPRLDGLVVLTRSRQVVTPNERYSAHSQLLRQAAKLVPVLSRHASAFFLAVVIILNSCSNLCTSDRTISDEVLTSSRAETVQRMLPDGTIEVKQTIERLTRTGAPLDELKVLVDELETNQNRDEVAARLLDELDASAPERSSAIAQLVWRTWLFHEVADVRELVQVGSDILEHNDLQGAKTCFLEAIARDPEYTEAWHQLARVHFLTGEGERALADIQNTLFLEPRHFSALRLRGLLLENLDLVDEAAEAREEAEQISPMSQALDLRDCFAKSLRGEVDARTPEPKSFCEVNSC
eukprot:TRINITY_DN61627_c0_g1_i1.p1 TRINITY_DN61627_c0_g1~~TRINITY_DN61627_c0_g1_i1.p1  ORF type:complete len:408 (-),score=22.40 TRINITY_DN61627_c0_g1_i1:187-1410(-)